MTNRSGSVECQECGAPYTAGLVACPYCKAAYAGLAGGVACPRCGDQNRRENAQCASCRTPLSRACLFCGSASQLSAIACQRCGEAFAGAEDRKRARDDAAKQQQQMQMVQQGIGVVGQMAQNPSVQSAVAGIFEALVEEAGKVSR